MILYSVLVSSGIFRWTFISTFSFVFPLQNRGQAPTLQNRCAQVTLAAHGANPGGVLGECFRSRAFFAVPAVSACMADRFPAGLR